jgi:hypothetical protein
MKPTTILVEVPQAMMDAALADEHGDDITILTNHVLEAGALRKRQHAFVEPGLSALEGLTIKGVYIGVLRDELTFVTEEKGLISFRTHNGPCVRTTFAAQGAAHLHGKISHVVAMHDPAPGEEPHYNGRYEWSLVTVKGNHLIKIWIEGHGAWESSMMPGYEADYEHVPQTVERRLRGDSPPVELKKRATL